MAGTVWSVDVFTGYEGVFATADDLGCRVIVCDPTGSGQPAVTGWMTLEDPRVDSTDLEDQDGTVDGQSTQPGKTITIRGVVKAPDQITLLFWTERMMNLLRTGDRYGNLTVIEPHLTRYLRVRRGAAVQVTPTKATEATFSIILYAPKPRKLGDPLTGSTGLPSSSGGLAVPFAVPFSIDGVVSSGQITLVNPGTTAGPVIATLRGPVTGPIITHSASGKQLVFSSAMTLANGEYLVIDMENHSVLAQGQTTRSGYVTSRGWSHFNPGGNTWALTAISSPGGARLDITATPAW